MKIEIEDHNKIQNRKKAVLVILISIVIAFSILGIVYNPVPTLDASELKLVEVRQDDIDIMAPVFGEFSSKYERLVNAPSDGVVIEIYLRAGSDVEVDSVIAKLSNPDLEQDLADEHNRLLQLESEHQTLSLQKQSEQLATQAQLADIENQIKSAELELNANQELAKHGIVAKIEFEKAKLKHQQLVKQQEFNQYRFEKQKQMHEKELQQKQSQVQLQSQKVQLIQSKIDGLTVKAGINGTLQQLNIELGQRLSKSASIAKVGSKDELIVDLKIPQRLSNKIQYGAFVEVNHKGKLILGKISQLSSVIENGFISAEVSLQQDTFQGIRPSQQVNAYVFVEKVKNSLYVVQKPGLVPLTTQDFFVQQNTQIDLLEKRSLQFGELSQGVVMIKSGVRKGDKISLNDLSQWQEFNKINIEK
ncbi:HlyD family efflux transporter periplasmic adaptor subunit [Shewanella sp. 202IG2-18]|uniref:HlyD family secretion protein n=1 Tax=Parashewanella hymeniacidonis TaxID=2807618 RepID=UPI0019613ABB|nr:HlyD family efflux transporter periplasmic adaptor subunit [Parashewanella hymeniacidonis]MBM7072556.1 HlyD family efflux transporter periplasmic adaptor subunit [Parashewanella hymeniacidonis]